MEILFENIKSILVANDLLVKCSKKSISSFHSLQNNTALIKKNDIYIALTGGKNNGHDFIPQAIEKGAECLIVEEETKVSALLPYFVVHNTRAAWSVLSASIHGNPEKQLKLYGVTGTDGKTSTVWMTSELIRKSHSNCLSIGTLGITDGTNRWSIDHTTPDPPVLFSAFAHALKTGIRNVIMEVSSHSLIQEKLRNLNFEATAFTSFSRDHLDFHSSMEEYLDAKCLLFKKHIKKDSKIFICDKVLNLLPLDTFTSSNICTYGNKSKSSFEHMSILENRAGKEGQLIKIKIRDQILEGEIPYIGSHNVENFLAALLFAENILGFIPKPEIWMTLTPVPGRCELIKIDKPTIKTFVDFAHTPKGLETTLSTLRSYTKGKLWVVFGCGGNRDRGKRPEMAKIAEMLADHLIITSDNPRDERPEDIIKDIQSGLSKIDPSRVTTIIKRDEAIKFVINKAQKKDTILIAGKGHEGFQIIGTKKIPFSDQEHARKFLKEKNELE